MVNCQGRFATAVSFGTLATLVGAVGTRIMRNRKPVLAVIHPTMPINKNEITKEMIAKAMQCETADELIALANSEGIELTKEEAEAYLAELEDFELDSDVLQKVAGGGVYETVSTIIKEVPNVVKNI